MRIKLAHGSGGVETHELIDKLVRNIVKKPSVKNGVGLREMDDGATIPTHDVHIVVTTDSYTVNPIFFPGGNIGSLAATGTLNDLAVMGAEPLAVLDSIVVEEGFPLDDLRTIVNSFVRVLEEEDVSLIGGDFKVMPKGSLDKIIITATGIGVAKRILLDSNVKVGDKIIVSGTIGEHGAAIMAAQLGIDADSEGLISDHKPLTRLMQEILKIGGVHAAKDPTRGGLAMALNEFAKKSKKIILVYEESIPIRREVKAYCEMLGIDPMSLACEGRVLLSVSGEKAEEVLEKLHSIGYKHAAIIGDVKKEGENGNVVIKTISGGMRILEPPMGEIVPRIC